MKRDSTVKIFFKFVNSASAAALQCQSEALLATAAEVLLQAQQLPRVEAAEGSTGSCLLLPGSLPVHQGYANAGADSTSMQENAHVGGFFLLFINMHVDKSPDHQCELREFRGRISASRLFLFSFAFCWKNRKHIRIKVITWALLACWWHTQEQTDPNLCTQPVPGSELCKQVPQDQTLRAQKKWFN